MLKHTAESYGRDLIHLTIHLKFHTVIRKRRISLCGCRVNIWGHDRNSREINTRQVSARCARAFPLIDALRETTKFSAEMWIDYIYFGLNNL